MKLDWSNIIYDPELSALRTKNNSEMLFGTLLLCAFLAVAIFWISTFWFESFRYILAALGFIPLLAHLKKKRIQIILKRTGSINIFYQGKHPVELPVEGFFTCEVTVSHGDSYHTKINHQIGETRTPLFHFDGMPTESDFTESFEHFGKETKWSLEKS